MQLTKNCPKYTYRKDGVYYFSKAVPKDLLDLYCKPRIVKCLGTRSPQSAQFVAKAMLAKVEDYWLGIRLKRMEVPAAELPVHVRSAYSSELPLMGDALDAYVQIKGPDKSRLFAPHAKRNVAYLIECLGDRPLDCYNGHDAGKFRDWLVAKGLGRSSLQRIFSVVKAIVNFNVREFGLNCRNAFSGVYLPSETVKKRQPIPLARDSSFSVKLSWMAQDRLVGILKTNPRMWLYPLQISLSYPKTALLKACIEIRVVCVLS